MKNLIIAVLAFIVIGALVDAKVQAQQITPLTPGAIQVSGTLANCPVAASGSYFYCFTTTGAYQSLNGAAYSLIGGSGATITINGTTKQLPATFQLITGASNVTVPATTLSATAPLITVQ